MGSHCMTHTARMTKHVTKTLIFPHKRRHTAWYNLHAPILALGAIHFKFHGRLKQCSISFQSMAPETTQNDECFYAYWHSVALNVITGMTRSMQGADTRTHARPTHQQTQGAPDQCTSLLELLFPLKIKDLAGRIAHEDVWPKQQHMKSLILTTG
jgi:hypothetical protein